MKDGNLDDSGGSSMAPVRIGVIFGPLGELNREALKYLVVHLNTLQSVFEYELLSVDPYDPLLVLLSQPLPVSLEDCRNELAPFSERLIAAVVQKQEGFGLTDRDAGRTGSHFSSEVCRSVLRHERGTSVRAGAGGVGRVDGAAVEFLNSF